MINIDDCYECAVTIQAANDDCNRDIRVSFTRIPDRDVLQVILDIINLPGFKGYIWDDNYCKISIFTPKGLNKLKLAETIATHYEQEHKLTVVRKTSIPTAFDKSSIHPVTSFVEL